jgi:hypothetical protein
MSPILFKKLHANPSNISINPISKRDDIYISNILINKTNISEYDIIAEKFTLFDVDISKNKICIEFMYSSDNFYKFILDLERYIISYLCKNSKDLYGFKLNNKKVNQLYSGIIKINKFELTLPIISLRWGSDLIVIDQNGKRVDAADLKEGMIIVPIINIGEIAFYQHKTKICLKLKLLQVLSPDSNITKHDKSPSKESDVIDSSENSSKKSESARSTESSDSENSNRNSKASVTSSSRRSTESSNSENSHTNIASSRIRDNESSNSGSFSTNKKTPPRSSEEAIKQFNRQSTNSDTSSSSYVSYTNSDYYKDTISNSSSKSI